MSADFVAIGEPMLEFNQLPPQSDGTTHFLEGFGGDTSNAAIAAARQGVSAAYLTALGDDWPGARLRQLWADEGVDASGVKRDPVRQTAVYFVTHSDAGHAFLHYRRESAAAYFALRRDQRTNQAPSIATGENTSVFQSGTNKSARPAVELVG